jgi:thioredoxin reductase
MTDPDFGEVRDITVIGAGPVGLTTAFWAGMREASAQIVDSLPDIGGQLATLYPEKWIFDVPGHPRILARDLVGERPLKDWGFELEKGAIRVDGLMRKSLPRVWACGDITAFDGKLKPIATGFAEAAIAVSQAVHHIRPEVKLQPGYSTNTGVPGVVEGQV